MQRVSELVCAETRTPAQDRRRHPRLPFLGSTGCSGLSGPPGTTSLLGLGHPLCLSPLQAPSVGPGPSPNKAHAGSRPPAFCKRKAGWSGVPLRAPQARTAGPFRWDPGAHLRLFLSLSWIYFVLWGPLYPPCEGGHLGSLTPGLSGAAQFLILTATKS